MVSIVGAGPGDVDLITVKGRQLLLEADVIIYAGSLVSEKHLEYAKEGCQFYNSAHMDLGQVCDVIANAQRQNKKIVRLHTGDPSIYGAVREQMDFMRKEGIQFEMIPGVSSFCGAAAALCEEYTLPDVTQTVILTRMEGRTAVPEKEGLESLSKHGATMILFLSTGMIKEAVDRLLSGYEPHTPAAVVYKATWEDQKIIRGTLMDISDKTKKEGITKTALIIVGNCLGNDYALSKLYDSQFETEFRKRG